MGAAHLRVNLGDTPGGCRRRRCGNEGSRPDPARRPRHEQHGHSHSNDSTERGSRHGRRPPAPTGAAHRAHHRGARRCQRTRARGTRRRWQPRRERGADPCVHAEEQLERRIAELESQLGRARVIEASGANGEVALGTRVRLRPPASRGRPMEYQIVSSAAADTGEGGPSIDSPVGEALLGRRAGDTVEVVAPARWSRSSWWQWRTGWRPGGLERVPARPIWLWPHRAA
jgi:transcription elongation GreA/GreB family factor